MICPYHATCSGCQSWGLPLAKQQEQKLNQFLKLCRSEWNVEPATLLDYQIHSLGEGFLRDRLDFTWQSPHLGLYAQDRSQLLDLVECWQLSPELQNFLTEFRKIKWPIQKGSLRLRVSPQKKWGAWLDFSHIDVKNLFAEKKSLLQLLEFSFVEIGQRHKKLIYQEEKLKLVDPEYLTWSETYCGHQSIPLYGLVGSFTQTGTKAIKMIAEVLQKIIQGKKIQSIYEFGCGIGSLTLALADDLRKIQAVEVNQQDLNGLQKTLSHNPSVQKNITLHTCDLQKIKSGFTYSADLLLVNPPRSGVGDFFRNSFSLPTKIIYMSCFPQSLIQDGKFLKESGYLLKEVHLIDQFPQTHHSEMITFWEKPNSNL
jgi:23S rRNA (uracil1939-C5)-methyltransferase